jgi:hypothetical protein
MVGTASSPEALSDRGLDTCTERLHVLSLAPFLRRFFVG